MLEVELYKIINPGHFWCKPCSRNKAKLEQCYTLIGKINDYCSKVYDQSSNQRSTTPKKGQLYLVKRTSDRCWYRAKILSMLQTVTGPHARVLLVDLGERTLVPALWVQEIPEEFLAIPFQTMECVLSGLKPISLVTSYFDLTTTKQPVDTWDVAASEWFRKQVKGSILQLDVKHIDDNGVHHVLLFATKEMGMVCLNDQLVNNDFAVLSQTAATINQDPNKFSSTKERTRDLFTKEHQEIIEQLNNSLAAESDQSDSSDSFRHAPFAKGMGHVEAQSKPKYQPMTSSLAVSSSDEPPERNGNEWPEPINRRRSGLSSDEECGKVRFLSARLPATGSGPLSYSSPGTKPKELRPILKASSGYSSGEQDEFSHHIPSLARLPKTVREEETGARSTFAHDRNAIQSVSPVHQNRPPSSNVHPQNIVAHQTSEQKANGAFLPAHQDFSSSSGSPMFQNVPQILGVGSTPSPSQSSRVTQNSGVSTTPSPSLPTDVSYAPNQGSTLSPSKSPRVHSLSKSPRVHSPSKSPSVPSPSKSPRVPSSPLPCSDLCHVSKDVFIHGEGPPRPITQIDTNTFPEAVLRVLREIYISSPSSFQFNVWPAILRGRDVCGIAETSSENIMAYIVPVVTQIAADGGAYTELPLGNGPLGLVLCSGWRKAATVYEHCCRLTKKIRNIRVQVLFGAGAEEEHILHLINGCEIIIATPPCFLRMLKKGYTRLDRLCHLVFDDADILAEEWTECIKEFMRTYGGLLKSRPNRVAPRQCIAMANKWTAGVCSLVKTYLGNPVILISNPVETAMFCKVRQTVKFISSSQRDSQLIGLLDSLTSDGDHEVIIFTSAAKDAERLLDLLQYYSYSVLLAHEFMRSEQLAEVRRQWNTPHHSKSYPILVMTDGAVGKCNVRNSTCVIHYDFPPSKSSFGKRLFCMVTSYPSTKERQCLSVIFGTELTAKFAQSIKQIVTRAGGEVPAVLESVTEMAIEVKEERKKALDLCYFLKAFGVCKSSLTCKERHTVFANVDVSSLLPRSGIVKVLVLKVLDASRYYVRILEHQSGLKETSTDNANYYSGATFLKLALDLNAWYASSTNRRICGIIRPYILCVIEKQGSYHRVKILRILQEDPETNKAREVEAYFVDSGHYENVSTRYFLEIAPQFLDIPFQAVEAFVCRVKPVDEDEDWTKKSYRFVQQHIEGQELEGKVVMGLGNTIWVDPLVAKRYLKEINVTTNTFNVRMDLLKEGLAVANPEHLKNLMRHFQSFVSLKQLTGQECSQRCLNLMPVPETARLPEDDDELISVSAVEHPGLLYVQLVANDKSLEDLMEHIRAGVDRPVSQNEELGIGSLCVAKFTEDNKWYRAKIFSIRPEREYDVFYVDYGDREWVTEDRVRPAWTDILQLPFQAIECFLVNISPTENDWTTQDGDALWDMTKDKLLYAQVKSKCGAMFAGTCRYGIELVDTSSEHDVLINHELVIAGHGQSTLDCHKALFPEAFQSKSGDPKEPYEEIPEICLQLYKTQDPAMKLQYAKEIKNIVSENMWKKDAIRECGGVRCVCSLLGVSKQEAVQEFIAITLAFLATQNDENCEEIRREGGLKALSYLLNKTKSVKVQEHTAWAIKNLATSDRNRDAIREFGGVTNLCQLLETTNNEKVQENICWALVALCEDNNPNCDTVREDGGLRTLISMIKTASNECVLENVVWAISSLACNAKNKKIIGEQGGIESICNLIKNNHSGKVFKYAVQSLKALSNYNDENRETMYCLGMIDVMRRLTDVPHRLPFETRRLCLDLTQRLLGRTSDLPLIEPSFLTSLQEPIRCKPIHVAKIKRKPIRENGKTLNSVEDSDDDDDDDDDLPPLEDTAEPSTPAVHPMTMWSQTKPFVTVSIKLRGVVKKVTTIREKNFYFRTTHMGKVYELDMELFATVLPKECTVSVRGSEVLVNLKKAQPSTWQRLLASPEKPPYLSVDFDRWDTDLSDEGEMPRPKGRVSMNKTSTTNKLDYTMLPENENESQSDITDDEEDTREQFFDFS